MFGYWEGINDARITREAYISGIKGWITEGYRQQEDKRTDYISGIVKDPEKYRNDFKNMLGFPLNCKSCMDSQATISKRLLFEDEEKVIYRATVTVLDTIPFTGLLFLHKDQNPHPFIISQHGGDGTPELISGFFKGNTYNYNDMTERIFRHGANVFAPQLLLWSNEYETDGFRRNDRNGIDAQLKQLGSSITALEVFCIIKALDVFCEAGIADENHLGMIGLSYGGFYTLFTAAADTRIKAALSCSFYNKRDLHPWVDWTWMDSAAKFFDAEVAMLVYPRCLCIAVGDNDEIFKAKSAQAEFDRLHRLSESIYGRTDWLHTCVFPGVHEFIQTDDYIETVIAEVSQ